MNTIIVQADYANVQQGKDIAVLMNAYAVDEMGGGEPLDSSALDNIPRELAKRPYAFSLLCYVEGKAVGLMTCFELFSTFTCKPLVNIHDFIILPEFRGRGLSQKMLKSVEEIALERGCCKLTLEVLSGNEIAKSSYRKFGFISYQLNASSGEALFWQKPLSLH